MHRLLRNYKKIDVRVARQQIKINFTLTLLLSSLPSNSFIFDFVFFSSAFFVVSTVSHAQDIDADEAAPNEPPYNQSNQQDSMDNELDNTQQDFESGKVAQDDQQVDHTKSEDSNKNFVPKWKRIQRALPSSNRLHRLNEDRGLYKITKKKEFFYDTKKSPQDSAMGLRFGSMSMINIRNPNANVTYSDIYKSDSAIGVFFDYEWQFFRSAGKLGLQIGGGFAGGKGNGRFESDPSGGIWGLDAMEIYSFYLIPLNVGLIYRFDYFHNQILVPYVDGGFDYYLFGEFRNDSSRPNFGATPLFHIAGGAALLLDWLSRSSMVELDKDHGINHLYLTAEYRILQRIAGRFDFSDQIISGGFMVEY